MFLRLSISILCKMTRNMNGWLLSFRSGCAYPKKEGYVFGVDLGSFVSSIILCLHEVGR